MNKAGHDDDGDDDHEKMKQVQVCYLSASEANSFAALKN